MIEFVEDDGGRAAAGFRGEAGDCVTRAISIAAGFDYRAVYGDLAYREALAGRPESARNGVQPAVYRSYLADLGWHWSPTMSKGTGCTVHLRAEELPPGRLVARLTGHLTAVVDGVLRDTHDCSRGGSRCVYGVWTPPPRRDMVGGVFETLPPAITRVSQHWREGQRARIHRAADGTWLVALSADPR